MNSNVAYKLIDQINKNTPNEVFIVISNNCFTDSNLLILDAENDFNFSSGAIRQVVAAFTTYDEAEKYTKEITLNMKSFMPEFEIQSVKLNNDNFISFLTDKQNLLGENLELDEPYKIDYSNWNC